MEEYNRRRRKIRCSRRVKGETKMKEEEKNWKTARIV
jgi:hypothetical protein